jgi:ankyrin repeat protein
MPASMGKRLGLETLEAVHSHLAKRHNPGGVLECIEYLTNELQVELDVPIVNDNTALTCAVEGRLHDVAAMLLAAGASVNHRFLGGGTALVRAILNDDFEMAKLLLEYRADSRLFVDSLGRPIYMMDMSEKMRQLIPHRP